MNNDFLGTSMSVPDELEPDDIGTGINRSERKRVHAAIRAVRNDHTITPGVDLHAAYHYLRAERGRDMSYPTFLEYAMASPWSREFDDSLHGAGDPTDAWIDDIDAELDQTFDPADLYRQARVDAVQDAVAPLPRAQYVALVRAHEVALDKYAPSMTDSESRNYRRAVTKIRPALEPLATGKFLLRNPVVRDPLADLPAGWSVYGVDKCVAGPVTTRQGDPVTPNPRNDSRTPQRMLDGIEFLKVVRPTWAGFNPSPVPKSWATHDVVNGVCNICDANKESK